MGSVFRFKRFTVDQSGCAMKINTDGVLLGAIAHHDAPLHILDIGTGTGVIALMLAQRFEGARIDAIDIDEVAAQMAGSNFKHSDFGSRSSVFHMDVAKYVAKSQYDLIVSNPPYFVNDLKNPEKRKEIARHAPLSFFTALLTKAASFLTEKGCLWLILPIKQAEWVIIHAVLYRLYPAHIFHVHSDESKSEFRQIICLSFEQKAIVNEHFYIYQSKGVYTDSYKQLLKDFFLDF